MYIRIHVNTITLLAIAKITLIKKNNQANCDIKILSKTNTFTYVLTKYNRKQKEYTDRGIDKENESANVP